MSGIHPFDAVPKSAAAGLEGDDNAHHRPDRATLPGRGEDGFGRRVFNRTEPVETADVVDAVHQPTRPEAVGTRSTVTR